MWTVKNGEEKSGAVFRCMSWRLASANLWLYNTGNSVVCQVSFANLGKNGKKKPASFGRPVLCGYQALARLTFQ